MPFSPTPNLAGLSPREAVADALQRVVLGMDSNDRALFESGMLKDESTTFVAGDVAVEGWTAVDGFLGRVFDLVTTHVISNVRVELKGSGEREAYATAHAVAYHNRPEDALKREDTSYTAGCLYFLDLVRHETDGELWKVKRWEIKVLWSTGDRAAVVQE